MENPLRYTQSATLDTLDYIKKSIFVGDVFIQLFYILYVGYRTLFNHGNLYLNIFILGLSLLYLIYHLITTKEFYTNNEKVQKDIIKYGVKILKYMIRSYLIMVAVLQLYFSVNTNDNMAMLMTVLMILGFILSIVMDLIMILVNKRTALIKNSFFYDVEQFRINHGFISKAFKPIVDFVEVVPLVDDDKMIKKIKDAAHKQEGKARRKRDFKQKTR